MFHVYWFYNLFTFCKIIEMSSFIVFYVIEFSTGVHYLFNHNIYCGRRKVFKPYQSILDLITRASWCQMFTLITFQIWKYVTKKWVNVFSFNTSRLFNRKLAIRVEFQWSSRSVAVKRKSGETNKCILCMLNVNVMLVGTERKSNDV